MPSVEEIVGLRFFVDNVITAAVMLLPSESSGAMFWYQLCNVHDLDISFRDEILILVTDAENLGCLPWALGHVGSISLFYLTTSFLL